MGKIKSTGSSEELEGRAQGLALGDTASFVYGMGKGLSNFPNDPEPSNTIWSSGMVQGEGLQGNN